jgi:predicted SprT family Zn-dependent metalloprotease
VIVGKVTENPASEQIAPSVPESLTHESHLHLVRDVLAARLNAGERAKALNAELFYGAGRPNAFGACFYDRWNREQTQDVIEIAAFNEVSLEQLWETLAHELAHTVAGHDAGHGPEWKAVAKRLGLRSPKAAGRACSQQLDPEVINVLRQIPVPQDGKPVTASASVVKTVSTPGSTCPAGIGTQDGKSRGPGSGSRLRLFMCECSDPPVRARVASDKFNATCDTCGSKFQRVTAKERRPRRPWIAGLK